MLDPLIIKVISIGIGLMFILAGYHKLADGPAFRIALLEYQVLPEILIVPASWAIPFAELMLGSTWVFGWYATGMTAYASAVLLGLYAAAIVFNIARGRLHFDCGCGFGGKRNNEQYLSGGLVARNVVLSAAALVTTLPTPTRSLGLGDYATLVAALLAMALIFGATNQLLANRAAINTWRKH